MPHLRIEAGRGCRDLFELQGLCDHMRAAMAQMPLFPTAGIRVRGYLADADAVADGSQMFAFVHMELMIGDGRSAADKDAAVTRLYEAARTYLQGPVGDAPFALTLALRELGPHSCKDWNSIRDAIGGD